MLRDALRSSVDADELLTVLIEFDVERIVRRRPAIRSRIVRILQNASARENAA